MSHGEGGEVLIAWGKRESRVLKDLKRARDVGWQEPLEAGGTLNFHCRKDSYRKVFQGKEEERGSMIRDAQGRRLKATEM